MPQVVAAPARTQPRVEVNDAAILRVIRPGVEAGLLQIGDIAVEFLLNILSVPVVYLGNGEVERSKPGEPPRMEFDLLRQSSDANLENGDPLPTLCVSVDRPGGDVAGILEFEMERPFMEPTRLMIEGVAGTEMQQALNRTLGGAK